MNILNLVTTPRPFFQEQCRALCEHGIEMDTLVVPGRELQNESRTVWDYARFYPDVLKKTVTTNYDLVHAHFGLTAPFAIAQPHRPVVLSLWGIDLSGKYGNVSKTCAQFADAVIVRNEEMRHQLGVDAHIVERGVDFEKFAPRDQAEAIKQVGWDINKSHVLFPYTPEKPKKNYPLAKNVVEEINDKIDTDVQLHAVYDEPHEMIPIYMNASDVLLMTSTSEGSPNAVKEALACNLPVISTDVGDVEYMVESSSISTVCNTRKELISGTIEAINTTVPQNERDSIKHLTWERTVSDLVNIYESVI